MEKSKGRQMSAGRIAGIGKKKNIEIIINGKPTDAFEGETIHAALIAAGYRQVRQSKTCQPRGVFCGMGVCFECLVTVNGKPSQQACMTTVEEGMEVEFGGF